MPEKRPTHPAYAHEHAARAHEQARAAIEAAGAARDRSEHMRVERAILRRRTRPEPVDPDTDAALRATLVTPPPQ